MKDSGRRKEQIVPLVVGRSPVELAEPWIAIGLGVVAFLVYWLTLAPGLVPGRFAIETVGAMKLLPGADVYHPLWLLVARGITAVVPVTGQVYALNLFSAICGALVIASVARLARCGIRDLISELTPLRLIPVDDETGTLTNYSDTTDYTRTQWHEKLACYGGAVAAVALMFSVPFWISANSLHSKTFDLLLFVITTDWAIRYHGSGRIGDMVVATFLLFLGLMEAACFIWLVPFFLFLLIRGGIRFGQITESFFLLFLGVAFMGAGLNTAIYLMLALGNQIGDSGAVSIGPLLAGLMKNHLTEIRLGFSVRGWMLITCQTLLPLAVAIASLSRFSPMQDAMTRSKWNVINLIFSIAVILAMSSVPGSVWYMVRLDGHLPVFSSLCAALAASGFFVYWMLVAHEIIRDEREEPSRPPRMLRVLSFGTCFVLVAATFGTVPAYFAEADGRKTQFADSTADIILKQAEELDVKCLLTDGVLDVNLLVRARVRGLSVMILPIRKNAVVSQSLAGALARVEEWMRIRPGSNQVATIGVESFWKRLGISPIPCGLLFIAKAQEAAPDAESLLDVFDKTVRPTVAELRKNEALCPELETVRQNVLKHASRMANELGIYLETLDKAAEASSLYVEAEQIDDKNLCAIFNRYGLLRLQGLQPDVTMELAGRILLVASDEKFADKLTAAVESGGNLAPHPADKLIPLLLADWGGDDASVRTVLTRACTNWLLPRPRTEQQVARFPVRAADDANGSKNETRASPRSRPLATVLDLMQRGHTHEAEERLRLFLKQAPDDLSAWAVLAEILLKRNAFADVREKVLPAMRRVTEHPEDGRTVDPGRAALVDLTEGCLHLYGSPPDLSRARSCFLEALAKKADTPMAQDSLLRASMALGNIRQFEEDLLLILSATPTHARANAVLGSLRLSQERFDEAEQLFKASITEEPVAASLNDYAELLRKQKRIAEAEALARRAIQASPDFYPAWDSLSSALLDQEKLDEAYQAIRCALMFEPQDIRLYLTLARIQIAEKNIEDAGETLERAVHLLKNVPATVREDFERLKRQVESAKGA